MDAIKALSGMRAGAPAAVQVVKYATLWGSGEEYNSPTLWVGDWTTVSRTQERYAFNKK